MAASTTLLILSWAGPILGVIGFIITPGMTHIRPWLMEKLNKSREVRTKNILTKNYSNMGMTDLIKEKTIFDNNYKFDLRKKIRTRKKELNSVILKEKGFNCCK